METKKITVEVIVNTNLQKVWDSFTNARHIVNWNFASDDWCCPKAENDLRKGGKLKSTMAAKDGSMSFDFEGIYQEVVEHKKIVFTMPDGRQVEVLFESTDGKTKVTESFDPETTNPLEMQRDGWQAILNNFKKYTEAS